MSTQAFVQAKQKIELTKGKYAIVDADDYERLNRYSWHVDAWGYARRSTTVNKAVKCFLMHREVLGLGPTDQLNRIEVDHINNDKLDNRKVNLRPCTRSQNSYNAPRQVNNGTGYKGVGWHKPNKLFRARITFHRKQILIGYFRDPIQAALAYDISARRLFGEYARLNFPAQ